MFGKAPPWGTCRAGDGRTSKIPRMIRRIAFGAFAIVAATPLALAELAMTGVPVAMRAAPSGKAQIVQRIPASAEIEVAECDRGWCQAWWRQIPGYIPADAVVLGPPPATLPGDETPPPIVYLLPTFITPPVWQWMSPEAWARFGGWENW
jgi:hypothetical protein